MRTGWLARYVHARRPGWRLIHRLFLPNLLGPFYPQRPRRRFYYWRRRRAELALADARYRFDLWGHHPGTSPSERDAMWREVEKCSIRLRRLEDRA